MTPEHSTHRSCSRGHEVPDQSQVCPVCGEPVGQDAPEETRGRSLWDLMGQPDGVAAPPSNSTDSDPQQPAIEETAEPDHQDTQPPPEDQVGTEPLRSRGLWGMMQQGQEVPGDAAEDTMPQLPEVEPMELAEATETETGWNGSENDREQAPMVAVRTLSRSCRTSLVTGIAATLLAGLGLVPPVIWTSLPALLSGLVAVYTGLVGASETRSSPDRLRGWREAVIGIGLGTLGMFLPRLLQMLGVA